MYSCDLTWAAEFVRAMTPDSVAGVRRQANARHQVISCVTKASACHHILHANHWHRLLEILAIIGVKCNITTFNDVYRLIVNMLYCGRISFNGFKHADINR